MTLSPAGRSLLIRADAGARIGNGHVMRCLALAQAWHEKEGRVVFMGQAGDKHLCELLESAGAELLPLEDSHSDTDDLKQMLAVMASVQPTWIVLDGYRFTPSYQSAIRRTGALVLVIDDMAQWPTYHADIILNQNISANPLMYPCSGEVRLLLGTNYVLLRREFLSWQVERAFPKIARRVLVTLGGSDPDNRTLKIIRALEKVSVPGLEAKIVVGSANPNLDSLRQASGGKGPEILTGVANMPELMAWADVAVTAGGSTCWESAFMGLPSLILIMSENQRANAEGLARSGIAINLGWFNEVSVDQVVHALTLLMKSQEARERMSALGQQLVDGLGASRALAALQAPISRVVKA